MKLRPEPEEGRVLAHENLREAEAFFVLTIRKKTPEELLEDDENPYLSCIIKGGDGSLAPLILGDLLAGLQGFATMLAEQNEIIETLQRRLRIAEG